MLLFAASAFEIELDQQIEQFDKLKYNHEFAEFYRAVFANSDSDQLFVLSNHKNDSIAIQSAWELVKAFVPNGEKKERIVPTASRLNWFLGMFEGRNRVAVPQWWRDVVLASRDIVLPGPGGKLTRNICPGEPVQRPYHAIKDWASSERKHPKNATLKVINGVVTYTTEKNSIDIPKELFDHADNGTSRNISCAFTNKMCFVAVHSDCGFSHRVACIDRQTDSVVWSVEACGCAQIAGVDESWVTLVATDDGRVFCFGNASCGIYAHAFDASNGKSLFQFSSNY